MIEKQTVLVLGAGASIHVGFPLGRKLIEDVFKFVYGTSKGVKKIFQGGALEGKLENCELENSKLLERFLDLSNLKKDDGKKYSSEDIKRERTRSLRGDRSMRNDQVRSPFSKVVEGDRANMKFR